MIIKKTLILHVLAFVSVFTSSLPMFALAVDNPDTPDHVKQFQLKCKPYEQAIGKAMSTPEVMDANAKYVEFLDKELNSAYKLIEGKLPKPQKDELKIAQREWLKYRDAETRFIGDSWTREKFGTSCVYSTGSYASTIVKDRIIQLLSYAEGYE
ncbi:MAG: DUF1311 domain-containing protein [Syntrophobacteraceae bacterium]|nr:DUF1311 domain-containing protein [Syntrophobacteraceae bacterium]